MPAPAAFTELSSAIGPLGNEPGDGRNRGRHDRFRRLHVLFEQERRDREHVADRVEPITRVVGRKLLLGLEVETGQVADRVAILDPVETADGHAARIGILGIDPENVALDPVGQEPHLFIGRTRLAGRRHDAGTHVLEHRPPKLRARQQCFTGGKVVQGDVPFLRPVAMAAVAIIDQDRLDRFFKPRHRRVFRRQGARPRREEQKQAPQAPSHKKERDQEQVAVSPDSESPFQGKARSVHGWNRRLWACLAGSSERDYSRTEPAVKQKKYFWCGVLKFVCTSVISVGDRPSGPDSLGDRQEFGDLRFGSRTPTRSPCHTASFVTGSRKGLTRPEA